MDNFNLPVAADKLIEHIDRLDRQLALITGKPVDKPAFSFFRSFDAAQFDARIALIEHLVCEIEHRIKLCIDALEQKID